MTNPSTKLEELLVRAHPNPDRMGCPGKAVLQNMAQQPLPFEDKLSQHVWHCSPCFQEFQILRDQRRAAEMRTARKKIVAAGGLAVCAAAALMISIPAAQRHSFVSVASNVGRAVPETAELDFSTQTEERGDLTTAAAIQTISTKTRTLKLLLPPGTAPGNYDVEIRSGSQVADALETTRGNATRQADGRFELECKLDAPSLPAGSYVAAWRLQGSTLWHYGTFAVL